LSTHRQKVYVSVCVSEGVCVCSDISYTLKLHSIPAPPPAVECNPRQVVNTRASVTKQYNLVPANGRWCLAAGKVTVGLSGVTLAMRHRH